MASPGRLTAKTALVTGAGSGLGRASAVRFAAEGARVACVDLDTAAAAEAAEELRALGASALPLTADVTSDVDTRRMVGQTLDHFGALDIVFANAGVSGTGSAGGTDEQHWDRVIDTNLKGVWLSSKYALAHMAERGGGSVINQASLGGLVGIPGIFPYAAAKGGVVSMTKQMAVEYGPSNIRVNAICPGTIPTPLVERSRAEGATGAPLPTEEANAAAAQRFPLRRLGEVDGGSAGPVPGQRRSELDQRRHLQRRRRPRRPMIPVQ